jgi:hypothetical protein
LQKPTTSLEVKEPATKQLPEGQHHSVSFLRHSGWVGPEDLVDTINIIGCGAVGSNIALLAAKMGFHNFKLWDSDIVESHNLANQAFDVKHVNKKKVDALADVLTRFNPAVRVETVDRFFTSEEDKEELAGPVVVAVDSMSARDDIYDSFFMNPQVTVVIDTRLGFDYGECFVINPVDVVESLGWKETIIPDDQVPDGPCNLRICTTLVYEVSAYAVHMICSRYAALRQDVLWEYDPKAMFSLTNRLRLMTLNER